MVAASKDNSNTINNVSDFEVNTKKWLLANNPNIRQRLDVIKVLSIC